MVKIQSLLTDSQIWWKADSISPVQDTFAGASFEFAGDKTAVSLANSWTYLL